MYLKGGNTVDNIHPGGFHFFCPLNVVGFIKPGLQFYHYPYLFAVFGRADEGVHYFRVAGNAVQGYIYLSNIGVVGCLVKKTKDGIITIGKACSPAGPFWQ
jgi:hypothetical protein